MLNKVSLGSIGLVVGSVLTVVGIGAGTANATLNLAGMFYGIPLLLGGLALKASELKPVPFSVETTAAIAQLRESQATATQNQIRKDVNRYRYGQKAHLDEALHRLGLSPTDEERPVLRAMRETETDGNYTLILEFESPLISLEQWQEKAPKITTFFGPNIRVAIAPAQERFIEVALICDPIAS